MENIETIENEMSKMYPINPRTIFREFMCTQDFSDADLEFKCGCLYRLMVFKNPLVPHHLIVSIPGEEGYKEIPLSVFQRYQFGKKVSSTLINGMTYSLIGNFDGFFMFVPEWHLNKDAVLAHVKSIHGEGHYKIRPRVLGNSQGMFVAWEVIKYLPKRSIRWAFNVYDGRLDNSWSYRGKLIKREMNLADKDKIFVWEHLRIKMRSKNIVITVV